MTRGAHDDPHGTVYIDREADPGAWAEAIANTPRLACQSKADPRETYERPADAGDHERERP